MRNANQIGEECKRRAKSERHGSWWWDVRQISEGGEVRTVIEYWQMLRNVQTAQGPLFGLLRWCPGLTIWIREPGFSSVELCVLEMGERFEECCVAYRLHNGDQDWILGKLEDAVQLARAVRAELDALCSGQVTK